MALGAMMEGQGGKKYVIGAVTLNLLRIQQRSTIARFVGYAVPGQTH